MRYIFLCLLLLLSGCYYYPYYPYRVGYAYPPRAYAPAYGVPSGAPPAYGGPPPGAYAAPPPYDAGQPPPPYPGPRQRYYGGPPPTAYAAPGLDPRNCGTPDEPKACGR
jgi:hypothetical protein